MPVRTVKRDREVRPEDTSRRVDPASIHLKKMERLAEKLEADLLNAALVQTKALEEEQRRVLAEVQKVIKEVEQAALVVRALNHKADPTMKVWVWTMFFGVSNLLLILAVLGSV